MMKRQELMKLCNIWRHTMLTSSNGNIFHVTGLLCGEFTGHSEFPAQRPVTGTFDVFFDLRLNQHLSKQWIRRWFETPSRSLWRHCYVINVTMISYRFGKMQCKDNFEFQFTRDAKECQKSGSFQEQGHELFHTVTLWHGNAFSITDPLRGESAGKRPAIRRFDFYVGLNKLLNKTVEWPMICEIGVIVI